MTFLNNIFLFQLQVTRQDDTPAPHEKIQLCLRVRGKDEWFRIVVECRNFTSSSDGFVDFVVPPSHRNIVLLNFVATAIDYPMKYYSPDTRWRVRREISYYINLKRTNYKLLKHIMFIQIYNLSKNIYLKINTIKKYKLSDDSIIEVSYNLSIVNYLFFLPKNT